jgi:hypothetical protein
MADVSVNALTSLATPANDDLVPIWDTSAGQLKQIRRDTFNGGTLTGGGTVATGGFTFTVPATGTAALLATANVFTAAQTMPSVARQTNITIADDAVFSFAAPLYGALVINSRRTQNPNISSLVVFTSAGPLCTIIAQPSTQVDVSTAILAGNTGVDGKFTVSLNANGNLYLENRTGLQAIISITILGG